MISEYDKKDLLSLEIKVADFGLSSLLRSMPKQATEMQDSRHYMAPELIKNKHDFNEKVDIWSLGCLIFYILGGKHAFYSSD